jgi:hypothetical protein
MATNAASFQCVELVKDYAGQLGLSRAATGNLGNGNETAQRLASLSDGRFTYFGGTTATSAPIVGSVISIAGYPKDPAGHVGIAQSVRQTAPNQYEVTLFDQNWPYAQGASWKTITFTQVGNNWVGTMPNSAAPNGTSQVSGWANPSF